MLTALSSKDHSSHLFRTIPAFFLIPDFLLLCKFSVRLKFTSSNLYLKKKSSGAEKTNRTTGIFKEKNLTVHWLLQIQESVVEVADVICVVCVYNGFVQYDVIPGNAHSGGTTEWST